MVNVLVKWSRKNFLAYVKAKEEAKLKEEKEAEAKLKEEKEAVAKFEAFPKLFYYQKIKTSNMGT